MLKAQKETKGKYFQCMAVLWQGWAVTSPGFVVQDSARHLEHHTPVLKVCSCHQSHPKTSQCGSCGEVSMSQKQERLIREAK